LPSGIGFAFAASWLVVVWIGKGFAFAAFALLLPPGFPSIAPGIALEGSRAASGFAFALVWLR